MERIQLVDVVIAGKHGGSIRLSVPAWICKKLGIRPGDRFAVYLTYDDEAGTEAILYVPVGRGSRSDDDSPARREGGRIIIADYVLGQESSSQPSSGAHGAEGLTAKRQELMCDGGGLSLRDYFRALNAEPIRCPKCGEIVALDLEQDTWCPDDYTMYCRCPKCGHVWKWGEESVRPGGGEPQGLAERANPSGIGPRGGPGAESSEPGERA